MADTATWTLQQFANRAGTRTAPYPHELDAGPAPYRCKACVRDLAGRTTAHGMPLVFCGVECQRVANRIRRGGDPARAVTFAAYTWNEW